MSQDVKIRYRKLIISSSILLLSIVTVVGISSLFSIWLINKSIIENEQIRTKDSYVINQIKLAQVNFKSQIQEWKNILLRGENQKDRLKYKTSFYKRANQTEVHFNNALALIKDTNLYIDEIPLQEIYMQFNEINIVYSEQISKVDREEYTLKNIQKIDAEIKGIDRSLDNGLTILGLRLENDYKLSVEQVNASLKSSYTKIRSFLLYSIMLSLLLIVINLIRAINASSKI